MINIELKHTLIAGLIASVVNTFIFGISEYPILFRKLLTSIISIVPTLLVLYFVYKSYCWKTSK